MHATLTRERIRPMDRSTDRFVALWSVAAAVAFLLVALVTLLLPDVTRHGIWLPVHLALAGSATAAIVGVMPFFVAAFAAAQPADPRIRLGSLVAVVSGAILVSVGVVAGRPAAGVLGGTAYVAGIMLTGFAVSQPLRSALGPSRGLITRAYLAALAFVAIGATTSTLFLAGWPPVADAWAQMKPAHAWINLVGFVSLVIAATLLHFYPTAVGARIGSHRSGRVTIFGIAAGAALIPIGYVTGLDVIARAGAISTIAGAIGLGAYVGGRWRERARWSTDLTWHRFVIGGLSSSVAWFVFGIAVASGPVLVVGSDPTGWRMELVVAPLVAGWVAMSIVASASHLLPAIGPGDQMAHARQRGILGTASTVRLVLLNGGVAALSFGSVLGLPTLTAGGSVLAAAGFAATVGLIARAIAIGATSRRTPIRQEPAGDEGDPR